MSTINPPEYQQSPSLPPPEVQPPPRKRHRVRKTLLIIGAAIAALILLIVVISLAISHSIKPVVAPSATPSTPTTPAASSPAASTPPPSSSVAQFGQGNGFTYSDGTKVSVTSAAPATLSQEAAGGNPGDPAVLISVRVTAGSTSLDASQIQVSVNAGPDGTQLSQAFDTQVNTPSGTLAPGEHGTYVFEFDLQHSSWGSALNVTVTPGFNYNAASFTGAVS